MRLRLSVLLLLLMLTGCHSDGGYVPVSSAGETRRDAGLYLVKRGDTLYSIAFRYGLDYQVLAAANNIQPPYMIYVNQRIRVSGMAPAQEPEQDSGPPVKKVQATPAPKTSVTTPDIADASISWQWPHDGEVVSRFSLTGRINKGIDIKGEKGARVRSSAAGVVVYAGGGLRGYGKLVIVKHNDRFLSAYGHNESILVREGDRVKAGQTLARIGGPNGDMDLLHFEIRRNGKPEDPLRYLPGRE